MTTQWMIVTNTDLYYGEKKLNEIISPYLPAKFQLISADNFLQILRTTIANGILSSLDVKSLFTNVPLLQTIEIICHNVYNHETLLPPASNEATLRKLHSCTNNCPFRHMDCRLYTQKDGVAIVLRLPTFIS